ncbi:MAG: MBOAT family protein [Clostridia bacterium]|nr:MBOAT family protein [Clostridia bacterium]
MVFSSIHFLFIFLPLFLAVYYLFPPRLRNTCLLIGSVIFYAYGTLDQPLYLLLILVSILVNWLLGFLVTPRRKGRRFWFALGMVYNFGWLIVFKYAGFLFSSLQTAIDAVWPLSGVTLPAVDLVLPIGISFYTFQIVSYLADAYRGTVPTERSLIRLGTYLCMFPQLIAGPIVTYSSVAQQLKTRKLSLPVIDEGFKDFTLGLGFKVLLANRIGSLWTDINTIGYDSISTPLAWMGIIAFSMQLYFDFYGYSLMAVGLGKMLGFDLPENFRHPYMSTSVSEFWRRWHITLGSWFREYVYIPLGGNRRGAFRTVFNLLLTWGFTGLWHGASWNFVLWGLVLFTFIALEKYVIGKPLKRFPLLGHLYIIFIIPLTWVLFAITDFSQIGVYFTRLFPFLPGAVGNIFPQDYLVHGKTYGILLLVGLLFCTDLPLRIYHRLKHTVVGAILLLAIFWGSVYCLYIGLNDPFLYFRF